MFLNRYEWIQFYILYFVASAIEYVEITHKKKTFSVYSSIKYII